MVEKIPSNFDPSVNPNYEFIPYDEDPAILDGINLDSQLGRDLSHRLGAWLDAKHELGYQPDSVAAQESLQNAEKNLEAFIEEQGFMRGIREKQD